MGALLMKDFLGQEFAKGDYVAGLSSNNETPAVFQIVGFTPMKCRLVPIQVGSAVTGFTPILKFGEDLLKLDTEAVEQLIIQKPLDGLLRELKVGDYVYGSDGEYVDPVIFEIIGFAPTVAVLKKVYGIGYIRDNTRLTSDLIKIDAGLVTMHCLTKEHG